ncbi:hypothetical protein FHX42_004904 [Saccharopolyspora lacisalsi]|uniref:NHLP leader peptide family natural product n=1 Tax=Halosaccharopolyspora lacisalsi TaxID=1000566 RepID=A0A839E9I9_9PSEU|nr:hypothetical protein [Halosaccharopolyspora lacisalsi]MBA8827508.1 hypothetical protein [Halosaccharopolyspora lacisalsi]
MDSQTRSDFVNAYTKVLTTAWNDEAFAARLESDPKAAVREFGLEVADSAELHLVRNVPVGQDEPDMDKQVQWWEAGEQTGHYELHIPHAPELDMTELTENDLEAVSAGYCCCCPCCCS